MTTSSSKSPNYGALPITPPSEFRTSLAIDFDGPIHAYTLGWHTKDIYDMPTRGVWQALRELHKRHCLFILTARDVDKVVEWCTRESSVHFADYAPFRPCTMQEEHQRWFADPREIGVTNVKLGALAYIDDRAVRFTNWQDIKNYFV